MLNAVPRNSQLDPALCVAMHAARTMTGQDQLTERPLSEIGMLGQWKANFLYSAAPVVKENIDKNNFPKHNSYRQLRQIAKRAVDSYLESGLIKCTDSVIEIGTRYGSVAKYLQKKGVDVISIEPQIEFLKEEIFDEKLEDGKQIKDTKKKELEKILPLTAEEYARENPGKKFSVVNVSNFYPNYGAKKMTSALAELTHPDGKTLIGVCCVDPQDISETPHNISPYLKKHFGEVKFISVENFPEFKEYFSVGGQMGFFECTRPKPKPDISSCIPS